MRVCHVYIVLSVSLCLSLSNATLSQSDRKNPKAMRYKSKVGPQPSNVQTRGLIKPEPPVKEILIERDTFYEKTYQKNFKGKVLGFVTPWNRNGYDIAKNFAPKFDYISPTWLQIRRVGNLEYQITGKHDIDLKWMKYVRDRNPKVKINVRVLFDKWDPHDYSELLLDPYEQLKFSNTLLDFCKSQGFDGVVLEFWSQLVGGLGNRILIDFTILISQNLRDHLELILVLPVPKTNSSIFSEGQFEKLYDYVDAFSLMTYDYSSPQRPGSNSPINWVKSCVEQLVPDPDKINRSKILLGLNFYGYDFTVSGGKAIVGHDYIKYLENYRGKLKLDKVSEENFFQVRTEAGKHMIFYPTLYSIFQRIQLAENLGTGLSIWELGQGLNYFYDLL